MEGRKKGEQDRKDREKNKLTSLHLIGSSCNHRKNRRQVIESRVRHEKGQRAIERKRENTATKVSSQR